MSRKDIIPCAVSSDNKSLIVDFQGGILYEWEHRHRHTCTHKVIRERSDTSWVSNTETNGTSATYLTLRSALSYSALQSTCATQRKNRPLKCWRPVCGSVTNCFNCHKVKDVLSVSFKPFHQARICWCTSAVLWCSHTILKIKDVRKARLTIQPKWTHLFLDSLCAYMDAIW